MVSDDSRAPCPAAGAGRRTLGLALLRAGLERDVLRGPIQRLVEVGQAQQAFDQGGEGAVEAQGLLGRRLPAKARAGAGLGEPRGLRRDLTQDRGDRLELAHLPDEADEVGDPGGEIPPVALQHRQADGRGGQPPVGGAARRRGPSSRRSRRRCRARSRGSWRRCSRAMRRARRRPASFVRTATRSWQRRRSSALAARASWMPPASTASAQDS